MPESKQLNVAMVGNGFIARAHSNAFHQVGRFFDTPFQLRTKLLCGRNQSRLEGFARTWGWEELALDWTAAVTRPEIDIIDIAVPNSLHAPIALAAAKAGKIVLCEKPLAMTVSEAEQMAAAVHGKPSLVWFNYRRVPAIAFAKQLIEEGRLGTVFHYRAQYFNQSGVDSAKAQTWRYHRDQAGSGASGDLLSHLLDTATYLNGEIVELWASKHTFVSGRDVDDAVTVTVRFGNRSVGSFEATRYGTGHRNGKGFAIYGSKGSLAFDLEDMNRLRFFDATEPPALQAWRDILVTGPDHPYSANFWKPGHLIGYEHTFIATLGDFLAALAINATFQPDFADGLAVQRLLDAVDCSSLSGRWTAV
jgi:predicted dehydrogenase